MQGEQAETLVARVKAEEGESRAKTAKSMQRTPNQSSRSKGKDTLATETMSSAKPQPARENTTSGQVRTNKQYSFKEEHVVSLFKLLYKSNKLKFPEIKRSEEVGKVDDPNYCLYHRML